MREMPEKPVTETLISILTRVVEGMSEKQMGGLRTFLSKFVTR